MKRTLSLIALVLSMSFPGGSAFAETFEQKGAELLQPELANTNRAMFFEQSPHLRQPNTALAPVKGDSLNLIKAGDRYNKGKEDNRDYDSLEYKDTSKE